MIRRVHWCLWLVFNIVIIVTIVMIVMIVTILMIVMIVMMSICSLRDKKSALVHLLSDVSRQTGWLDLYFSDDEDIFDNDCVLF